jgi:hypothetical protein
LITETKILDNSIAELPVIRKVTAGANQVFTVQPVTGATVDITLDDTGMCREILFEFAHRRSLYVPVEVTPIGTKDRFYSAWRRDGEALIKITSLEPHSRIYATDL